MCAIEKLERMRQNRKGFTLVELAIVIVIIGLIVGGVLVGQDMIGAAEIRSTIAQIQSYDSAKNTFKDKYGMLPGDGRNLGDFGFTPGTNAEGISDGDGRLEGCGADEFILGCETALYWMNMSEANLIGFAPEFGTGDEDTAFDNSADAEEDYLPEISIGSGNFLHAYGLNGLNYYLLANISVANDGSSGVTSADAVSPIQAENIDRKMDDGRPNAGSVRATDDIDTVNAADAGALGDCAVGTGRSDAYNTATQAESDAVACQLRIRQN